jgi:hypothetical protein
MATVAPDDEDSERQGKAPQYSPSWVDRFNDWVEHRPWPSWSYYLGIGAGMLIIQAFVVWIEGALPFGTMDIAQAYLAGVIAFMLALIHYLDKRASLALTTMRPALLASDREFHRLFYRLTTLPARTTILASLATLVFVFLTEAIGEPYRLEALATFPVSAIFLRFVYLICWWVFGAFLYHTVHQLRVINLIYTRYTRVDLLRVKPLYGFSTIAALTAGSLAMIAYGWLLANPWIERGDPLVFIPMVVLILSAVVTFIWPQLGIHTLQTAEKERMLDEANLRLEAMISELHQQVDNRELVGMEDLNLAMASLEIELNTLRKTPTWPWEPEVLQVLITALALPLGLWLIQLILERTIGS